MAVDGTARAFFVHAAKLYNNRTSPIAMARFFQRLRSFAGHSGVRRAYSYWLCNRLARRPPLLGLPGGGFVSATDKFNDYYGICVQHPGEDEFLTYKSLLGKGGVYVDVGANMGLTCVLANSTGL